MKELVQIQTTLKAPKNQRNSFGNYNYRSCEDIVEALKPMLTELKCFLNITDEMVMFGDRFYIKATATLTNAEGKSVSSNGWAREALIKKGMDESQITGATSSYARKYALNGLLAIDDTKDADATNKHETDIAEHSQIQTKPAQIQEIVPKDIAKPKSDTKVENKPNTLEIVPIGKNRGKKWVDLDDNTLKDNLKYYDKLINANPNSPYKAKNQEIIDYITNILLGR